MLPQQKFEAEEFRGSVAVIAAWVLLLMALLMAIPLPKVQAPTQQKGPSCCTSKTCQEQHHHVQP